MKPLDCLEVYSDAKFYDQEFAGRIHEIPFYLEQARKANGPVLEIGCGTGRLTMPIAQAGIKITGLEISRPMLDLARGKSKGERLEIAWLEQDCRSIKTEGDFALVFSAANAMQHLHDLDSVNAFLKSARRAIRDDGRLILDVFNPDPDKLARKSGLRYHHKTILDGAGREIRVEIESEYHAANQILTFRLFYLLDESEVKRKNVTMRCFYPEELLAICRFNGFEVIERYGDYDKSEFTDKSPKQILVCRKDFGERMLVV